MVTDAEKQRFIECIEATHSGEHHRDGIGTLGERTLHLILKKFLEPDSTCHEVKIGRYVADICRSDEIIEIQTRAFASLAKKIEAYRPDYRVTVVYPIASVKHVSWVDPETGEVSERHKSPKRGNAWDILPELYALREKLPLKGVRFMLIFMAIDDYKLLTGKSRDRKSFGAVRYERIPSELCDIVYLENISDYAALVPPILPGEFTAAQFAKAAKMSQRTAWRSLRVLMLLGVIEQVGMRGRAYLYGRVLK